MASREKKPLAPSKSKQKASGDSGLSSNEVKSKKGKSLPSVKQQQVAQEIFDTLATGSQLSAKLEASLPCRNALKTLKRKQNLRAAKANLIKSKVTKKVTNKDLYRVACGVIRGVKAKKVKQTEESTVKAVDTTLRLAESQTNNGDNEGKGTETPSKSAKNNLRTKKTKSDIQNKEEASASSSAKVSPKLGRKGKAADSPDSLLKSAKTVKLTNLKKNNIKDNLIKVAESDNKGAKSRKSIGKELDCGSSVKSNSSIEKLPKAALDNKSSIDLTIDEVIACSMLSDTEVEGVAEKTEGKVTRSKKMLVDENTVGDIEIKKEPDTDDMKIPSDGEYTETDQGLHMQNAIQLRKRKKIDYIYEKPPQRRRKQRQLADLYFGNYSGNSADNDLKKRQRLNSEGTLDNSIEHISDCNINTDSCFSDPGCNESQSVVASSKREISVMKNEIVKNFEEDTETVLEVENNNNSDRVDRIAEIGPTLRSKTKAKIAETEATKDDDVEDIRVTPKLAEAQEDLKKHNLDPVRKDSILVKIADKSKGRRSSLNIDTKKTVNSFYNTDKSDGNSKSQIDQMIESIKLNIAKSIEKKIFGPEKSLGLSKNFDAKIEEIVAPLSTESQQKMGLEENTDEDRSTVTKNEITSDNSENSVPKVADTAKEIEEKLVKFDIGEAETHSQSIQENKASNSDRINDVHNTSESTCNLDNNNGTSRNSVDEPDVENVGCSTASSTSITSSSDNESKTSDENKKTVPTRKSSRISDKSSDSGSSPEAKKSSRTPSKAVKSDNAEDVAVDAQKTTSEETIAEDATSRQISDNAVPSPVSTSSEQIEERFLEDSKQTKETEELDADILNVPSDNLEESETLESISREVERLVAGEQCAKPLATSDTSLSKEMISDILDKEDEDLNEEEAAACCNDNSTSSAASSTNGTNNSHVDDKSVETSEMLQEDKAPCKSAQNAKHFKPNNNHSPTTANCDSNSEYSSVNSVPTHTCTSNRQNDEAENLDQDDTCKDINKSSDTSNLDENASDQKPELSEITPTTEDPSNKASDDKSADEQKPVNEENRRVLRARDKQKKAENKQNTPRSRDHADSAKIKTEESVVPKAQNSNFPRSDVDEGTSVDGATVPESSQKIEDTSDSQHSNELDSNELERQARTRRSREVKKRKEDQLSNSSKTKRVKRDLRKSDQQNKEETLLDNEVAKINENNRAFLSKYDSTGVERTESFREFFEQDEQGELDKVEKNSSLRSKSENDIRIVGGKNGKNEERQLSRNLSENHVSKQAADNIDILESECKTLKTPEELAPKDSDEASTSGESSSNSGTPKILETPEDKEKKESILRLLGLEPLEEATLRMQNQQKSKREQLSSSGTLKTVIRVSQKDKDKDKKGSRSPLKMVLKQQGRGDGEGDSPEFYTIQKEFGTSGLGDSSSGANRKFTTNHRHSCDDDNEETAPKDRQSLVIPEKSSSFSIHPERVCADVCCYCFGKFGSLDTPMHLAQMKSDERRKKILNIERHLNKDSCLCDACYRHVDRKANTSPTNLQQKPQKQHRQLMISKCSARECRDSARHHVKRRWLLKIKTGLQNQVDIDWESTQHTTMPFCVSHYEKIGRFLTCALCKRRLARAHTYQVASAEIDELNQILGQQGVPVSLAAGTFVCKLCRYFTQLQRKYKDIENMNLNHKSFCKSYRRRILHYLGVEVADEEDDDSSQQVSQVKDKKSKKGPKNTQQLKSGNSKSPDRTTSGTSEKSTPEPNKNEGAAGSSEMGNETRTTKTGNVSSGENGSTDMHYLGIESAVESLKKRKMLDLYTTSSSCDSAIANEMVEILGMDNEITLTRLPKKPKVNSNNSNDITPVVQRLGANPSISVRTLFPGEEEMNLHVNIEFQNVREVTPQGWEKCATMIQYDRETKLLWQQLQRPYGNQSSFLRHLILLEKYYRAGDLILAPNASRNAINYSTSVQNRLISYEGPEKMDEPIMEPIAAEYNNSRRLSGGYVLEKERLPGTSTMSRPSTSGAVSSHSAKMSAQQRVLKLNSGVSIIKKPPPSLQRLNLPSSSGAKRKDGQNLPPAYAGKVFQVEPEVMRVPKRQKLNDKQSDTSNGSVGGGFRSQYQKAPVAVAGHNQQFHKHLRMQQEMLSRQSRSDFEPLICDITRTATANENSATNLIQNFNLPKSIQVTTKPTSSSNPIPILPKIPKSLTVIPQTITRPADK